MKHLDAVARVLMAAGAPRAVAAVGCAPTSQLVRATLVRWRTIERSLNVFVAMMTLLSLACASSPMASESADAEAKRFSPSPNGAVVYVSRPGIVGGAVGWDVFVDGTLIATLPIETYTRVTLPPGSHTLTITARAAGGKTRSLPIDASDGVLRFFEVTNAGNLVALSRARHVVCRSR